MKSWPASIFRSAARPMLACAIWYLGLIGLRFVPPLSTHDTLFMILAVVSAFVTMGLMMVIGSNVDGKLELYPDRVVLGKRSLPRLGLHGQIVAWKQAHLWTTLGSAIHLQSEHGSLLIGGRDRLVVARSRGSSTQKVHASVSADDFVDFVRALGLVPDPLASAEPSNVIAIDLQPSVTSIKSMWRTMSPWFATMGIAASIGMLAAFLPALRTGAGLIVIQFSTVVVVVGGLAFTMVRSMRAPGVRYQLRIDPPRISLYDLKSGGAPLDASVPRPAATRAVYRYSTRGGPYEFPAVHLTWPSKSIVVGVWDTTLTWPAGTERTRKLEFLVGPEEWRRLTAALGLS